MKRRTTIACMAILLLMLGSIASAQTTYSLEGRSAVSLNIGYWNQGGTTSNIYVGNVHVSAEAGNALGGLTFTKWMKENMAGILDLGGAAGDFDTSVGAGGVSSHTFSLGWLRAGAKYYFMESTLTSAMRPYVSIVAGPYFGSETNVSVNGSVITEAKTQTAVGAKIGAGADIIMGNRFMLGLNGGYNLISDFSDPVGGRSNYSGVEFSIGFHFLWGGGKGSR